MGSKIITASCLSHFLNGFIPSPSFGVEADGSFYHSPRIIVPRLPAKRGTVKPGGNSSAQWDSGDKLPTGAFPPHAVIAARGATSMEAEGMEADGWKGVQILDPTNEMRGCSGCLPTSTEYAAWIPLQTVEGADFGTDELAARSLPLHMLCTCPSFPTSTSIHAFLSSPSFAFEADGSNVSAILVDVRRRSSGVANRFWNKPIALRQCRNCPVRRIRLRQGRFDICSNRSTSFFPLCHFIADTSVELAAALLDQFGKIIFDQLHSFVFGCTTQCRFHRQCI